MSGKGVEMKVHYLDCGVLYPLAATSFMQYLAKCTCLCMLLEVGEQLVLVDTGMSGISSVLTWILTMPAVCAIFLMPKCTYYIPNMRRL